MKGWSRSLIGLITLILMGVGGWYLLNLVKTGHQHGEGTSLILRFSDAHGVPLGGNVRHKGVRVGEVLSVDVAPDDSGVIMKVAIGAPFLHTVRRSSRFWIVRPQFGGIGDGASGLDTLIKDPYVEFDTPVLTSPRLLPGSVVFGMNRQPVQEDRLAYNPEESARSRIIFTVSFTHARGLREGAPVLYRDVPVGVVLNVDLSLDGRSVETEVLVQGRYRETVRTDSLFWVAKPNVEIGFHWPSIMNVTDLSKILTGAALTYATPTDSNGRPVQNRDVLQGVDEAPRTDETFEGPLVSIAPPPGEAGKKGIAPDLAPVGISFAFSEKDWFSDDRFLFQGTGLLFQGSDGKTRVLTARTLADGSYSTSDLLSASDVAEEDLKVLLPDRSVHQARLVWTDPDGRDLAVIEFIGDPITAPLKRPGFSTREKNEGYYWLLAFREGEPNKTRSQPIPANQVIDTDPHICRFHPDLMLNAREWFGAVLVDDQGAILGLVGREQALSDEAAVSILSELPTTETEE